MGSRLMSQPGCAVLAAGLWRARQLVIAVACLRGDERVTEMAPGFPAGLVRGVLVVTLPAELTFGNARDLRDALDTAFADHAMVIVDMTATEFCDSSGVAELVFASKRAGKRGDTLRLAMARARVPRFFKLTGADRVLEIYDSVSAALGVGGVRA
jgi:anti-anti-sigma factor